MTITVASFAEDLLGPDLPIRIRAYDGSVTGPPDADAALVVNSPDAVLRLLTAPGELGAARAYVAGDVDIEGDIWSFLELRDRVRRLRPRASLVRELVELVGGPAHLHRLPPPSEECRPRGSLHSRRRDAQAVSHHYDVSNDFYRLVLGPSMTYSCAVFEREDDTLEQAQHNKYELICRKLGLRPGMRLLDIGCGWGGMVMHAAAHHDVDAVGVTISKAQADLAEKRVADAGLSDRVEIRLQDYRDVSDGPYDTISSIGMFEHVGLDQLTEYFTRMRDLVRPGGRVLNHAISRDSTRHPVRFTRRGFIQRYVFPDGELHEVGTVVSAMQDAGIEVRHLEGLREHYALTLRRWVANLESNWDRAVAEVGLPRCKVWRLYMAGSAVGFEDGRIHVDQVLGVRPRGAGTSAMPLRPAW